MMFQAINFFKNKSLKDHIYETKKVKVDGILFTIKKIDPLSFLDGSDIMQSIYAEYELMKVGANSDEKSTKKVKKYLTNVFMFSVVSPKLTRKKDDSSEDIFVNDLFVDWDMVNKLHDEILDFTYGKKKTQLST